MELVPGWLGLEVLQPDSKGPGQLHFTSSLPRRAAFGQTLRGGDVRHGNRQALHPHDLHCRRGCLPPPCIVSWCCHNRVPQSGWLKEQQCIFSQFRRPEVPNERAYSFTSSSSPSPWFTEGLLLPESSRGLSSVPVCPGVCLWVQILPVKTPRRWD